MILCDVNIFIYAHREDAPGHPFYRTWLEDVLAGPRDFLVSELVLSAFIRIVTHPLIFRPPSPLTSALAFAEQIRQSESAISVMPGSRHWGLFSQLCVRTNATGNLVPDAYFAALAIEAQAEWITADADYAAFAPDLAWRLLRP
jgi:uncharacterized protein